MFVPKGNQSLAVTVSDEKKLPSLLPLHVSTHHRQGDATEPEMAPHTNNLNPFPGWRRDDISDEFLVDL